MEKRSNVTIPVLSDEIRADLLRYLYAKKDTVYAYVHSFGCQLNVSDGERICGILGQMGYVMTDSFENADLILLNTCAVRESAEDHVYGVLGNLKQYKRKNPDLILVLCGCMASEEHTVEFVRNHYPFVDIVFGTASLSRFPQLLLEHFGGEKFAFDVGEYDAMYEGINPLRGHSFKAAVPVMFGCNNFCTYCIVPYVRGRERSRKPEHILDEVKKLVSEGYKEIMLLGQNVNSYGKDLDVPVSFAELLRRMDEIEGDFVLRFLSSHPKDVTPELMDVILGGKKIGRHLHLPIQSGSDTVLDRMNRRYTAQQYRDIVSYLRERDPDFSLTTDIIVGFPDETEEDFQCTLDMIKQVQYDNIYTFIYSKRRGTKAAKMDDHTSDEEKRQRMKRLLALQREVASKHNQRFIGKTLRVLVESQSKREGYLIGKDNRFIIVEFKGDPSLIGSFQNVIIKNARNWAVEGELAEGEMGK